MKIYKKSRIFVIVITEIYLPNPRFNPNHPLGCVKRVGRGWFGFKCGEGGEDGGTRGDMGDVGGLIGKGLKGDVGGGGLGLRLGSKKLENVDNLFSGRPS